MRFQARVVVTRLILKIRCRHLGVEEKSDSLPLVLGLFPVGADQPFDVHLDALIGSVRIAVPRPPWPGGPLMRRLILFGFSGLVASLAAAALCQAYPDGQLDPPIAPSAPAAVLPSQPSSTGIDDLIVRLEAIKARKEALEREEKETRALLKEKLKALEDRVEKLGVNDPAPACLAPQPAQNPSYAVPVQPAVQPLPGYPPAAPGPTQSYKPVTPVAPPRKGKSVSKPMPPDGDPLPPPAPLPPAR
jgi:hypothetical protein